MSLINEALRKAQNQRNQAPGLGDKTDMSHQPVNYSTQPNRLGLMIGLGLCIVILLGLIAGLTIVIMSKDPSQTTQQTTLSKPEAPALQTTPKTEAASIDEATNESADMSAEAASATASEPKAQLPEPQEPLPDVTKEPAKKTEPDPKIAAWLEQSTISGIRITDSSSKVILNNKAFVPGDSVNMSLGLKILEIEPKRIRFIDPNGVEYVKLF